VSSSNYTRGGEKTETCVLLLSIILPFVWWLGTRELVMHWVSMRNDRIEFMRGKP
jgi:hypothetical protein